MTDKTLVRVRSESSRLTFNFGVGLPSTELVAMLDGQNLIGSCDRLPDEPSMIEVLPVAGASLNVIRKDVVRFLTDLGFQVTAL